MAQLDVDRLRRQAAGMFAGFTRGQKTMMGIAAAGVVIGLYLFSSLGGGPTMAPLYGDLAANDASAITDKLNSQGVRYTLANGGTTIMVPKADVYQLRLDMSAAGLPTGGAAGYSLLDKQGITTSQFRQRVDYQRAMEGELARTIEAIDGVQAATVHLVIPADDVFAADDKKASASVLVKTGASSTLSPMQVQAVVNLVASSIEGLTPDEVTVADNKGQVLSVAGADGTSAALNDMNIRQRTAYEQQMQTSLENMLAAAFGPGKAKVKVTADLDFDQSTSTSEKYAAPTVPAGSAPLASGEVSSNETYTGPGTVVAGVLGPTASTVPGAASNGTPTNYQKIDTQKNYALDKTVDETKAATGTVNKLSVAVLVDSASVKADQVQQVTQLVTTAAGIDTKRGDTIQVTSLAFDKTAAAANDTALAAAGSASGSQGMLDLIRTVGAILIIGAVLFLAWRSMRKASKGRLLVGSAPIDLRELDAVRSQLEALPAGRRGSGQLSVGPGGLEDEGLLLPIEISKEDRTRQQMETEITELVDRQPEEVAHLLRGWLAERRGGRR